MTDRHRFIPDRFGEAPLCKVCGKPRTESIYPDMLVSDVHEFDRRDVMEPELEITDRNTPQPGDEPGEDW